MVLWKRKGNGNDGTRGRFMGKRPSIAPKAQKAIQPQQKRGKKKGLDQKRKKQQRRRRGGRSKKCMCFGRGGVSKWPRVGTQGSASIRKKEVSWVRKEDIFGADVLGRRRERGRLRTRFRRGDWRR